MKYYVWLRTKNVQFSFNDLFFRQTNDVAMRSPLGPIFPNIVVGYFENSLISRNQSKPFAYCSYVSLLYFHPNMMKKFFTMLKNTRKCKIFIVEEKSPEKSIF